LKKKAHSQCLPPGYFVSPRRDRNAYFVAQGSSNKSKHNKECVEDIRLSIRNVAVIAHVDHGKTTLSDALLWKAGLLHRDRAGDQNLGRSLDTLKDEKERGITIKSAAITLNFAVTESLLSLAGSSSTESTSTKIISKQVQDDSKEGDIPSSGPDAIYIGNLPYGFSAEQLRSLLASKLVHVNEGSIQMNVRRAYATITTRDIESKVASTLLALNGFMVEGRALVVQAASDSPMHCLKDFCTAHNIDMPSFAIAKKEVAEGQEGDAHPQYIGTATWCALGGVIIQAPRPHGTIVDARQGVARECLQFLHLQLSDCRAVDEQQSTDVGVSNLCDSKMEDKSHSVSKADRLVPLTVNLIDCPGHIEFSGEVAASLRVSDGALVVVDAIEGKTVQTQGVIAQALKEGVTPILMLNKVDRLFISKQYGPEEVYDQMIRVVDDINAFVKTHQLEGFPDQQVSFAVGSVCFGSGYYGWACSINSFVNAIDLEGDVKKDDQVRRYLSKRENFIKYIIRPIIRMHRLCGVLPMKKEPKDKLDRIAKVNELLSEKVMGWSRRKLLRGEDASTITPQELLKKAMMAWLPAADPLIDMIAEHVPSPVKAQKLRARLLYDGDVNDPSGQGISNCAADGPTIVYISKMVPSGQNGKKRLALGRIFSGTLRQGDNLRAIRTDGSDSVAKVSQIKLHGLGSNMTTIPKAQAGQLIALEGIDKALGKAGTLTSSPDGMPICHMNFAVTPIVQCSVRPKVKTDLTKMATTLQRIADTDSTALFYKDPESGEHILAGAGELHIEVLISSLKEEANVEVELSEPIIAYRETVHSASSETALAKSTNKHNRVWIKASPLDESIILAMTNGELVDLDTKALGRKLGAESSRIWATGPEPLRQGGEMSEMDRPTCILVDSTFGLQIPEDARSNIVAAFLQVTRQGVLVNAPMRGVRFDLVDARFHKDSVHRRPNSVVPTASRAMRGAVLLADSMLVEPIYCVDIMGAQGTLNNAYSILGQREGVIVDTQGTKMTESIQACVPVRQSFGLAGALRLATHGHAQVSCRFDGMKLVPSDRHGSIVLDTRRRKGLDEKIPEACAFIDRL